jgi:ABC-type transport system involved in multi-copper enzyme maturation permease subunit
VTAIAFFKSIGTHWPEIQMVLGGICLVLFGLGAASGKVRAIGLNTVREELRKKILYFLVLFGIIFIVSSGAISKVQPGREGEAVAQTGVFVVGLFGMLVAVFSATAVLYSEIRSRTIFLLFSHPVWSFHIILGKFLGVVGIVFVSIVLMGAGCVVYFIFSPWWPLTGKVALAVMLLFFQLVMLVAMCVLGSTFLSRITNILLSMVLFFVGLGHSFFSDMTDLIKVVIMKYYVKAFLFILPNFQKFSPGKDYWSESSIDAGYVFSAVGDSLFRAAVMVALGILFFRLKEVGTERWE